MEEIIDVTDEDFQQKVIEKSKDVPVVVDFWAPWCGPCNTLGPVLERLAGEYKGKFILARVNVDMYKLKAQEYGVMGIPSVKMFKGGAVVDEFTGALPEPQIMKWLDDNLTPLE